MKTLRHLFARTNRPSGSRFDRYYAEVARSGAGYPTADEARRDLQRYDRSSQAYGWFR
ncbi:MAG: hypothetical protein AVDCRST_MAG49-863 [uncultured Thermomicrobiales bacterium]|uniref:Uncharacterized protein n=1 Tax=uncultured Thermomicrobiales bacterium TaxID=1645740 RepID=A0A6J4U7N8_9BACT|nr:MAG: hypothetical protein AVDCRST_MAG49-863 [uncultured Thermomicrobiales bacterium]